MKVLFYFGIFARNGGIEEFTRDLGMALIESGVEVEVVCASLKNPILNDLKDAGAKVMRVPVFHGCRWRIPDIALVPLALFRARSADVVVHRKPLMRWVYASLSRKPRHIYITAYRPGEQFPNLRHRKSFFAWFDGVFTQIVAFKEDLDACGLNCPVQVIPHIPPAVQLGDAVERDGSVLRIGLLGRLEPQKNPLYAFVIVNEMAKSYSEHIKSLEFHIYGSGSLETEMKIKSESFGFPTVFHGRYARSDVPEIVHANDLFLITSISEGQCIVALEILAGGCPVFATPVGALPQILRVEERGAILPEGDARQAASVIHSWQETHSVSRRAIQTSYARDYETEAIKQQYVNLIKALVENK